MPILSSVRLTREARRLALDQEHRDARWRLPASPASTRAARKYDVGGGAVGDEHLGAVDHVVVAVAHGARADGRHVAAAAGLGDRDGGERLAAADGRQVLLLERLAARPVEVRRRHVAVDADGHGERARARARALLVQHGGREDVGARRRRTSRRTRRRGGRARPCAARSTAACAPPAPTPRRAARSPCRRTPAPSAGTSRAAR